VAEESGLIVEIGEWCCAKRSVPQALARNAGARFSGCRQLSPSQLAAEFLSRLKAMLREALFGHLLESNSRKRVHAACAAEAASLHELRELGIGISVRHFAWLSSLSYLKHFPITKQDRPLVRARHGAGCDTRDRARHSRDGAVDAHSGVRGRRRERPALDYSSITTANSRRLSLRQAMEATRSTGCSPRPATVPSRCACACR